jgi:TM2 domain-containing membrane protein YozV
MAASLSHGFAGVGRFLRKELVAAWPVFLFFLTGFLLLISLVKLVLADFSIEITAISNAVVGALFAAKTALVLDETPLARSLERYRRIVAVIVKTLLYGITALLMGYLERFLEALHKVRSFDGAIRYVIDHADHYRLLAWALGISIVFALYFSFVEISVRMGEGALRKLFFESPGIANGPDRPSHISAGKPRS